MGGPGGDGSVDGGLDKRPGANPAWSPSTGRVPDAAGMPGRASLTGGGLPRTTADLAPRPAALIASALDDPQLNALASKVRDPKMDPLLRDLATVLALFTKLKTTKSQDTSFEVKGKDREELIDGIATVRGELAGLAANDADAAAFTVAVHHKLEEVSPYLFQLNIKTI